MLLILAGIDQHKAAVALAIIAFTVCVCGVLAALLALVNSPPKLPPQPYIPLPDPHSASDQRLVELLNEVRRLRGTPFFRRPIRTIAWAIVLSWFLSIAVGIILFLALALFSVSAGEVADFIFNRHGTL